MKNLKEIYNIENESAIREYLELQEAIYDKFWGLWKPKIQEVVSVAKKHDAEYVFEKDFQIYFIKTKRKIIVIDTLYGITIYKEMKEKK